MIQKSTLILVALGAFGLGMAVDRILMRSGEEEPEVSNRSQPASSKGKVKRPRASSAPAVT